VAEQQQRQQQQQQELTYRESWNGNWAAAAAATDEK
jgi:hypothetical protein